METNKLRKVEHYDPGRPHFTKPTGWLIINSQASPFIQD